MFSPGPRRRKSCAGSLEHRSVLVWRLAFGVRRGSASRGRSSSFSTAFWWGEAPERPRKIRSASDCLLPPMPNTAAPVEPSAPMSHHPTQCRNKIVFGTSEIDARNGISAGSIAARHAHWCCPRFVEISQVRCENPPIVQEPRPTKE